eukprot:1318428-Rhodomonas_salina.1
MAHCAGRWQAWSVPFESIFVYRTLAALTSGYGGARVAGRNQTKSERLAEAGLISMTSGHLRNMENFNT